MTTKYKSLRNADEYDTAKQIAKNTWRVKYKNGLEAIRFHYTDIITIQELPQDGVIYRTYETGGWETITTRKRMNDFGDLKIYQRNGNWICTDASGNESMFYDGIQTRNGEIMEIRPVERRRRYLYERERGLFEKVLP